VTVIRWIIGFEHFGRLGIKLGVYQGTRWMYSWTWELERASMTRYERRALRVQTGLSFEKAYYVAYKSTHTRIQSKALHVQKRCAMKRKAFLPTCM